MTARTREWVGRSARRAVARARGRLLRALVLALIALAGLAWTSTAWANVASLDTTQPVTGQEIVNSDGTVKVTVTGSWTWPFGSLGATAAQVCDQRIGTGWGVVWADPTDTGHPLIYHRLSGSVAVGSKGTNPTNTDSKVTYDKSAPCGTFTRTDTPASGDGNVGGTFTDTHTYSKAADVPAKLCVVFYDLGIPRHDDTPTIERLRLTNPDNSLRWALRLGKGWDTAAGGANCFSTSAFAVTTATLTSTASTTTTTAPTTTTTAAPATKAASGTSASLAFTGAGGPLGAVAAAGAGALVAGIALLLLGDRVRRAGWRLVGR